MKRTLSHKELVDMHACDPALGEFASTFKTKAFFKDIVDRLHELNRRDWEAWLLKQHPDITTAMLANGANVHAWDDGALYCASRSGNAVIMEILLKHGADVHIHNDLPLRDASFTGHITAVKLLLKHGADVHANDDEALRNASFRCHAAIVELLLKHGANVHARDDQALREASCGDQREIVKILKAAMKAQ